MKFRYLIGAACIAGASGTSLSAENYNQTFPQISVLSDPGVDMQGGHYVETGTDMVVGPLVVDHDLNVVPPGTTNGTRPPRHYATSMHGRSWRSSYAETNDRIMQLGGIQIRFHIGSNGEFTPLDSGNVGWKMVASGQSLVLTHKSGKKYTFNPHSSLPSGEMLLTTEALPNGQVTTYQYDSSGRSLFVSSNGGYGVRFEYGAGTVTVCGFNTSRTYVTSFTPCSSSTNTVVYGVAADGRVTSVRNPLNDVTNFQYDGQNRHYCTTLPNSATCRVTLQYGTAEPRSAMAHTDQVVRLTDANSKVWTFEYENVEDYPTDYTPYPGEIRLSYVRVVGPESYTAFYQFGNGYLREVTIGATSEAYDYSSNYMWYIRYRTGTVGPFFYSVYPSVVTYPEGNQLAFSRDDADNVTSKRSVAKPGSGAANIGKFWEYPTAYFGANPSLCAAADAVCDKPTAYLDARNNRTDFTYDATHGGLLTETGPPTNAGIRPQTRYTYTQRYARINNGGGGHVYAATPIWLPSAQRSCRTTAASGAGCAGGSADEVVTTYDYGPDSGSNNLLLRGVSVSADGQIRRTCFGYDEMGRKISETAPNAGLGSCS